MHNILDYMTASYQATPDKIAFSNGLNHLSFREVKEQCDAIGTYLTDERIYQQPVIVFMAKQPEMVAAFFGVVRGGNYYVPLDVEMPRIRIEHILESLDSPLMICDEKTNDVAKTLDFKGKIVLYKDICSTVTDQEALNKIAGKAIDTDPVYIVFTSGSTGIPKGVVACHRSVIDYIEQLSEVLEFNQGTVFGNQSPLYFDACLKEIYPTLKFGATTYLIPAELFMQPVKLVEFLNEFQINTICWVVSAMTMISAFNTFNTIIPKYLRSINFGSEVFPLKEFHKWQAALPDAKFVNLYGPTECTGMCCYHKIDEAINDTGVIPVGRPFKNTEIIILNELNERVKENESGEICVRGTSLTLGYYNDFAKTNENFVQNPLNKFYPELIYRTGDIGYFNNKGEIVFCSRKDHQIKHMGNRIELGEIEASIYRIAEIKMACCVYDQAKNKIRLFYVGDITGKEVTEKLKNLLPRYMMPNSVKQIEKMPLKANGKIDRGNILNLFN
ncbi:MAG: amino acid adenylation domain-containing protein [Lachnospiraceae bacterium]|nr:amino acid adenylation domain-containing protein [Lachnospiraceae bacterium]